MLAQKNEVLDAAESLLVMGASTAQAARELSKKYGYKDRQARKYVSAVYERWEQESNKETPRRREKIFRMTERFYVTALKRDQFGAATSALGLLAKLSGSFAEGQRPALIDQLGPVPTDPTEALIYAQKAMIMALREVVCNPSIDPEKRLRWISEIGSKIGMTHAKTLVQHKLAEVTRRLLPDGSVNEDAGQPVDPAEWDGFENGASSIIDADPVP